MAEVDQAGEESTSGSVHPVRERGVHARSSGPTYRSALRNPEFAALYAARTFSDWGDQLARVAIAASVLERSGSALYAAAVFAVSVLPTVFGQALLAPLADRYPRRTVMVSCDVLRAVLVVFLVLGVVHHSQPWVLFVLVFSVGLSGAPFFGASQALLTEVFEDGPLYLRASSLMQISNQFNQVAGVAIGGVVVLAMGPSQALAVDALTFAVSGTLIALFVKARSSTVREDGGGVPGLGDLVRDVRVGTQFLRGSVVQRSLMLLAWLMLLVFVAPEAIALPYAYAHGASTAIGGVLYAATPLGAFVGVLFISRWSPQVQLRRLLTLATCVPLPLLGLAFDPPWAVTAALFFLAGSCQGFMVSLMGTFARMSPSHLRARLTGLAGSGFALVSTLTFLLVGGVADLTSPAFAVVVAAVLTLLVLAWVWLRWPHEQLRRAGEAVYS